MVLLTLTLLTSGCAQVKIKDSTWCGSLGSSGATCFHTLTNAQQDMTLQEFLTYWGDLAHPVVCTSSDTLTDWKATIEKLCSDTNECSYQQLQTKTRLLSFVNKVDRLRKAKP